MSTGMRSEAQPSGLRADAQSNNDVTSTSFRPNSAAEANDAGRNKGDTPTAFRPNVLSEQQKPGPESEESKEPDSS